MKEKKAKRCKPCSRLGPLHPNWKGGRSLTTNGYIVLRGPEFYDHLNAMVNHSVYEHIFVMSEYLGRPLKSWETVHHINTDRSDNHIENLQLRVGNHGSGAKYICHDCGSDRIDPVEI